MEVSATLAVLFMLMLVFNAAFNLFAGLCAAFILWRDLDGKSKLISTIETGRYETVEDHHGVKRVVSAQDLEDVKKRDREFEEWLMMN